MAIASRATTPDLQPNQLEQLQSIPGSKHKLGIKQSGLCSEGTTTPIDVVDHEVWTVFVSYCSPLILSLKESSTFRMTE